MILPSYLLLHQSGELSERATALKNESASCKLCPHHCMVNRLAGHKGTCGASSEVVIWAAQPEYDSSTVCPGTSGVGNIIFANCNMRCVYCQEQHFHLAEQKLFQTLTVDDLAEIFVALQGEGCSQLGLISATNFLPQIIQALIIAIERGFKLPLVYNTNCYESVEVIDLLAGIVDIWLPNIKYADDDTAQLYSGVSNYLGVSRAAITAMYNQVGHELVFDEHDLMVKGLIVHHMILPNDESGTEETFCFIAHQLSPHISVSIQSDYEPSNRADKYPLIARRIFARERNAAHELQEIFKLPQGDIAVGAKCPTTGFLKIVREIFEVPAD